MTINIPARVRLTAIAVLRERFGTKCTTLAVMEAAEAVIHATLAEWPGAEIVEGNPTRATSIILPLTPAPAERPEIEHA